MQRIEEHERTIAAVNAAFGCLRDNRLDREVASRLLRAAVATGSLPVRALWVWAEDAEGGGDRRMTGQDIDGVGVGGVLDVLVGRLGEAANDDAEVVNVGADLVEEGADAEAVQEAIRRGALGGRWSMRTVRDWVEQKALLRTSGGTR